MNIQRINTIHANCLIIGDVGVLICGNSGSGKSTLTRRLIDIAQNNGHFCRLVGDDRICVATLGGRLIASFHPRISGKIEIRGVGIANTKFEEKTVVRMIVHCRPELNCRIQAYSESFAEFLGVLCRQIEVTVHGAEDILAVIGVSSIRFQG